MAEIHGFYPVHIRESRYGGTYSGGQWVLMAGHYAPEHTDAFGSDTECMRFWSNRLDEGPVTEINGPRGPKKVYAAAGNDPSELVEEAREHIREHSQYVLYCYDCEITYKGDTPNRNCPQCETEHVGRPEEVQYDA